MQDSSAPDAWRPAGRLTIEQAAQAHAGAAGALARGVAHVDLSDVERIDTAGCQVLLKMAGDARAGGLAWQLSGAGPGVLDTIRRLGCELPLAPDAAPASSASSIGIGIAAATPFEGLEP
jgi:anti-anti-sigma regulatory factor